MNHAQIAFGVFTLIVGVGIGYLMYTHPEGLNPSWPMGMAMLVPALFALGGLHIIAAGLDRQDPCRGSVSILQSFENTKADLKHRTIQRDCQYVLTDPVIEPQGSGSLKDLAEQVFKCGYHFIQ